MDERKPKDEGASGGLLESFGRLYAAAFEPALQDLSGQPATCFCIGQAANPREHFLPLLADWSLMFEVPYASVPSGRLGFFFKPKEAWQLCHPDHAAAPESVELTVEDLGALRALIDQIVGLVAPQIQPALDVIGSPSVLGNPKDLQQLHNVYFSDKTPILVTLMVEIEALNLDAQVLLLISPALAKVLSNPTEARPATPTVTPKAAVPGGTGGNGGLGADRKERPGASADVERNLERILDIELPVALNFGHTQMLLKDVLQFSAGSIIQLDKTVDEPVYLMINNKVIARGEVVIVDGNYGIRITEIESTADRIRSLR